MNVAIIGCGLIGQKRAASLGTASLVTCADVVHDRAVSLASRSPGCVAVDDWRRAVDRADVDIVVIATRHDSLAQIAQAAAEHGKHILIEKPAARFPWELLPVMEKAGQRGVMVRVGFNHRYHRAVRMARKLVDENSLGPLMFVRARYGHGGRPGYDQEWRARPELSGGGELIDQGVHLIDLARWFLGEFTDVQGFAHTYYWKMPVDDNAFLALRTADRKAAFLHASCTEWKNLFSMEIYGRDGKLHIEGLGGSYGVERLYYYRMLPQMGPPETTVWEYPMADNSWSTEFSEFLEDIRLDRQPSAGLGDAYAALEIVHKIYKDSGYDHHA